MSHLPQRKEKNCLNCKAELVGRYCHVCGQENTEPKESAWHLVSHFFNDITHFDGKFFSSLKLLITRPGFLSEEYIIGKRASYLNPIRMYVFTSAIFFLVFFSMIKFDVRPGEDSTNSNYKSFDELGKMDSASFSNFTKGFNNGKPMTRTEYEAYIESNKKFHLSAVHYRSRRQYDSLTKAGVKKDNWFQRQFVYKDIALNDKYRGDAQAILKNLLESFLHRLPQLFFILLPLFAAILKLLYIRKKNFYYVDHAIFTIHFYIFAFITMLVIFGINKLQDAIHWGWLDYIRGVLILIIFFYLYKCLKNFYKQKRAKTVLKFFILLISIFIIDSILFGVLFMFSLFQL